MAGPINGAQLILQVNGANVAFQRDVSFDGKNKLIDTSNKLSGRRATYLVGRQDEDIKLDYLFSDDASYTAVQTAFRDGDTITVAKFITDDTNPSELSSFTLIETADAVITDLSEKFKDQDAAMATVGIKISGNWA